ELVALPASFFELAAGRAADFVDAACVGLGFGAEVHARAIVARGEGHIAEMAGLELLDDVVPAEPLPTNDVLLGDEDAAIAPRPAANTATQAVELRIGHCQRTVTLCGITCAATPSSSTFTGASTEPGAERFCPVSSTTGTIWLGRSRFTTSGGPFTST